MARQCDRTADGKPARPPIAATPTAEEAHQVVAWIRHNAIPQSHRLGHVSHSPFADSRSPGRLNCPGPPALRKAGTDRRSAEPERDFSPRGRRCRTLRLAFTKVKNATAVGQAVCPTEAGRVISAAVSCPSR